MIDQIFKYKNAIRYHLEAPLLQERLKYLRYWEINGAAASTLQDIARSLLMIIDFLNFNEIRAVSPEEIKQATMNNKIQPKYYNRRKYSWSPSKRGLVIRHALGWFDMLGCLEHPNERITPFTKELFQYAEYMRKERGLSENTIKHRLYLLQGFCSDVAQLCNSFSNLIPIIIDNVLLKKN